MCDGDSAMLHYKLNFDAEVKVPMVAGSNGKWSAAIPMQPKGTLIRFRISNAGSIDQGSWPRAGDGMSYHGTVVVSEKESQLPQLSWFVKDAYYERIYNDKSLYRDNGYPTVIAFDGEVFDRAMIRIKGNQSRLNQKRKWKVVLPAGYETNLGGLLKEPVNEFALNSAVTDKSFVREILTSELQEMGGGLGQQVFPLRFEKNNEFYGLYLYQEQPDGRWRKKFGFSDSTASFKSDRQATLNSSQLDLPDSEMRGRYQRRTQGWLNHVDEVRELISQVNNDNKDEVLSFVYTHVDVPQVIEAMATMRVAQHLEWEHKNHLLLFDPADRKWRLVPIDFDLNFGRRVATGCNSLCEEVSASGYMAYMEGNRLGRLFLKIPELRELLDRRTRTLADQFLKEGFVEERVQYWEALLREDAQRDRKLWFTYGEQYSMQKGQEILLNQYFIPKRDLLIGADSKLLPAMQKSNVAYALSGESVVTIGNSELVAIDISGVKLLSLNSQVPAGTVLGPGKSALFSLDRLPTSPLEKGQMHIWIKPNPSVNQR
jgi:spore coat protein CotH